MTNATLHTNFGDIVFELFSNHAPETVLNFVGLATGAKEWTDPHTGVKSGKKLYDGTIFHRVIAGFMIQGGDPLGEGFGGPGYKFNDEIHPELSFDRQYLVAMANSGSPGTNGSQFFLVYEDTTLGPNYTIWGEITSGLEILEYIAKSGVKGGRADGTPIRSLVIQQVTVR